MVELFAVQKERLFLWAPVCVAAGIAVYFGQKAEPSLWPPAGTLLATGAGLWLLRGRRFSSPWLWGLWLALAAFAFGLAGYSGAILRTQMIASPVLASETGPLRIEGTVRNIDIMEDGRGMRLLLSGLVLEGFAPESTPRTIRVTFRQDSRALRAGDRVAFLGNLNPPRPPVAPGAFDFQRFAFFRQIGAFGFSYTAPEIIDGRGGGAAARLEHLRDYIGDRVRAHMPAREAGIGTALMTGERAAISEADWQDLRASGLAHIISISGLHIGMVAGIVFFTVRLLMACFPAFALRHPIKKYAAATALAVIVLYMFLIGLNVPTVRSVIMTGLVLVAIMLDRIPVSLRLVALAALAVLLAVPDALLGASFQMSFAAVIGLVAFYEGTRSFWSRLYERANWWRRGLMYLGGVCLTTVIASFATAPFGVYHFQQFAVYGLLANLVAVPVTAFIIMPAALLSYIVMPLGLDGPVLWVMAQGIAVMLWISAAVAALPHAVLMPAAWPLAAMILLAVAGLCLCFWRGWFRLAALLPLAAGAAVILLTPPPVILASGNAKLVALRLPGGEVLLSTRRQESFAAEVWLRMLGADPGSKPRTFREAPERLACDEGGCRYEEGGKKVSFVFHPAARASECAWADIVVAQVLLRHDAPCRAAAKIDYRALRDHGAHALYGDGKIRRVGDERGARPWTVETVSDRSASSRPDGPELSRALAPARGVRTDRSPARE